MTKKKKLYRGGKTPHIAGKLLPPLTNAEINDWYYKLSDAIKHHDFKGGRKRKVHWGGDGNWPDASCSKPMDLIDAVKIKNSSTYPSSQLIVSGGDLCNQWKKFANATATALNKSNTTVGQSGGKKTRRRKRTKKCKNHTHRGNKHSRLHNTRKRRSKRKGGYTNKRLNNRWNNITCLS